LKQLQLIQILSINARSAGTSGGWRGNARRVNRIWPATKRRQAVSGNADTAFGAEK
jgi:hypothetical protein